MGVTVSDMYYNPDFVANKPLPELLFVLIHEMCHIAMGHSARGKGKDHEMFNVAADLYINKRIAEDFNLNEADRTAQFGSRATLTIKMPEEILYCNKVDTVKDTPESIYEELYAANRKMQLQQGNGNGSNQDGGVEMVKDKDSKDKDSKDSKDKNKVSRGSKDKDSKDKDSEDSKDSKDNKDSKDKDSKSRKKVSMLVELCLEGQNYSQRKSIKTLEKMQLNSNWRIELKQFKEK